MATQTDSKNTPPKAEPAAAPHHPFTSFDPMAAWTAGQQNFQKMMADAQARAQAWTEEYAAMEAQMFARARTAIDTWAQLARDTLAYGEQMAAQTRKLSIEAVRRASAGA